MKNLILLICLVFSLNSFSQANILNASTPSEIGIQNFDQKQSDNDSFLEFAIQLSNTTSLAVDLDMVIFSLDESGSF